MNENKVVFLTEDGEKIEFEVVEELKLAGINYLLVCRSDDKDDNAYIMKQVNTDNDEAIYEMVEDDDELKIVGDCFGAELEDIDITQ
jgi:hypothetical protein